ncbi:MAG: copper-translocating P-type ATPase, partial [Clostridia bacterium]|nr:copper-translocating P-type ATPase [Clostridia bacterium]
MKSKNFKITGMTCASCSNAVDRAVKKLAGVSEHNVNLVTELMSVTFDESKLTEADIIKAVEKAGYEASVVSDSKEVTIPIAGMTCASCSQAVERALSKLAGIETASVNLATEKAAIKYNPEKIRLSEIKQAINKAGYQALEIDNKDKVDEDKLRKEKEIKILWTKFIVSAIFSIPLLYIAMGPMVSWWNAPIPGWLEPMQFPLTYALTEILLVIPAIIAGYRFYTVG